MNNQESSWIFTFGINTPNGGNCVRINGTYSSARHKMFELFGDKWAFQYSLAEWEESKAVSSWSLEKEISIKEALKNAGK